MQRFTRFIFVPLLIVLPVLFSSCTDDPFRQELLPPNFDNVPAAFVFDDVEPMDLPDGIKRYVLDSPGEDLPIEVVLRDQIRVHMTLRTESGDKIYSTYQNNNDTAIVFTVQNFRPGFPVTYGSQQAFTDGLRKGVLGMNEGERAVIVVPPEQGFKNIQEGSLNEPYRDETLVYDIMLYEIL